MIRLGQTIEIDGRYFYVSEILSRGRIRLKEDLTEAKIVKKTEAKTNEG